MRVRDAVEADAEAMARLADVPAAAAREAIHARTVRVADDGEEVVGFVAFDAHRDVVHVTQLRGESAIVERLLEDPTTFASNEGMVVETVLPPSATGPVSAVEAFGFTDCGPGPRFDGERTRRYEFDPK